MSNGAALPTWAKEALKYGGVGGGFVGAFLVVYFAIAQPMREDFKTYQADQRDYQKEQRASSLLMEAKLGEVVKANQMLREEFAKFGSTFTEWTRQVFVSRDLYDQRRAETDRRISALETELAEMRKGK